MDYYQTITAHLLGEAQVIKSIRADEASALPKVVVNKLRQAFPSNGQLRAINAEDILAVVNIKTCRMLKLTGKVWNQLSSGDEIWLVTPKEWKEHSEKVLIHECKIRHGKKLMIRNPTALSPKQLYDMVELYFPNIEKKFTELVSPVSTPPPKLKPSSAMKEKAPFLKAHKGSPNKNGALSYSERRKNLVSSPVAGDAQDAAEAAREEGSPSPTGKRKLSPSHLAVSNREQTVLPPLSPTLLRRVGLGRNLEMIPAEAEEVAPHSPTEQEEEKRSEGTKNATPPRVLVDLADAAESVAAEEHKLEANTNGEEGSNELRTHNDGDGSLHSDSAGQWSDVNIVGDDATLATLTTFTNSVANSGIVSSVHDVSTTPGNTMYGYESRRGRTGPGSGAGALVVEIDLEDLLNTPTVVHSDIGVDEAVAAGINLGQEDFYYELDSADDSDSHSEDGPPRSPLSSASSSPEQEQDLSPVTPLAVSPSHVHSFSFGPTAENVMVMESLDDGDLGAGARPHAEVAYIHPPRAERRRVRMEFNPQYDEFNENTHLRGTPSEDSPSPYQGSHREWSEMEDIMSVGDVSALSELSVNSGFVSHPLLFQTTRPHSLPALVVEGEEELESHDSDSAVLLPAGVTAEDDEDEEEYTMEGDLLDDSAPVLGDVAEKTVGAADDDDCVDASIVPVADPLEDQSLATDMPLSAPSSPRAYTTEASSIAPSSGGGTVVEDDNMDVSMVPIAGSPEDQSIITEIPLARDQHQDQDSASVIHTAVGPDVDATTSVEEDSMDVSMVPVVDSLEDQSILTEMPPSTSAEMPHANEVPLGSEDIPAEVGVEGDEVVDGDDDCLDASMVPVADPSEEQSILTEVPPALSSTSADFSVVATADEHDSTNADRYESLEEQLPVEKEDAGFAVDDCAEVSILPVADPLHDDFSIATELPASTTVESEDEAAAGAGDFLGETRVVVVQNAVTLSDVTGMLSIPVDEGHIAAVRDDQELVHLDSFTDPGLSPLAVAPTPAFADTISTLSGRSQGELELEIGADGEEEQGDGDGYAPVAEEATPSELSAESQTRSEENDTVATEPNVSKRPADNGNNAYGIALVAEDLPEVDEDEVPLPAYQGGAETDGPCLTEPEGKSEVSASNNIGSVEVPAIYDSEDFVSETTPVVEGLQQTAKSVVEPEVIAVMDAVVDAVVDVDADLHYFDDCEASEEDGEELESESGNPFEATVEGEEPALGIVFDTDFDEEEVLLAGVGTERTVTSSSDGADAEGDMGQSFDDDLIFSADQLHHSAPNAPAYPLYPLGLSDSLESEGGQQESEVLLPEPTTQPTVGATADVHHVEDVAVDSESALDALFDSLAGELSHLSEEFHHSHDFSLSHPMETVSLEVSPVDNAAHTPLKAVLATASADFDDAHSPLMASTSLLITLSPDRELEYSSLFIRSPGTPEDSAVSSSEGEEGTSPNDDLQEPEVESELLEGEAEEEEIESPVAPPPSEDITPVILKRENLAEEVTRSSIAAESSGEAVTASSTEDSTSPRAAPETPTSVLSTEVALELQVKVQRQAEELAEAGRVKAALEARLDETRQLLQIFAAGRAVPLGTTGSPTSRSKLTHSALQMGLVGSPPSYQGDIDLDALENTLKSDSVQSIAAEGLHHISHLGGGPASSSKMRKSLRRLLERKREEKNRGNGSPRATAKTLARSGDEGGGEESSPTVPHLPKQRARPGKRADDESSDSGFSSDARSLPSLPPSAYSSPRTYRKGGISAEAAKRSRNSSNDSQESPLSKLPPKGAHGGSIGIADHLVSVDELEMEVKYVQGLVYRGTETIASPVRPTLDLSDFYSSQSQSSDAHSRSFSERGPAVELTEAINALRQGDNSPPPPPPPQQVPEHAFEGASGPQQESSSGLRPPFGLNLNMNEDSVPPKNAHILSPRHLNVQVSSSSDDELSQVSLRSFTLPKTPPVAVFSPLNSQQSLKTASTSPKVATEPEDATRSPLTLPDGKSIESFNPADADSAQVSEGDSSVESNNPLLLESTPKIRGLGRSRPMQPPSSVPLYLGANNTSVQFSDVPEVVEYDRLHGHFFQDDADQKPREASPPRRAAPSVMFPGECLMKPAEATTFVYNYDTYHAMRPDLFLDSGPNSPFNPHSPFLHHAAGTSSGTAGGGQRLTIMGQLEEQRCAAELSARIGKEEVCSSPQRVLMETQANTVANAGITSNLTAILRSTRAATPTTSATPSSVEKVKFSESPIITAVELDIPAEQSQQVKAHSPVSMPPATSALTPPTVKLEEPRTPSPVITPPASKLVTPVPVLAAHSPPPPSRPSTIPVSAAKAVPTAPASDASADKLAALFAYSLPLLVTARYMENPSLRGMAGRQEIARITGSRDLLSWCVFQAYGTPDGAIVKGIKMIQVVRALKDAEVCTSITTSQLDLLLTKINLSTKAAASPVPSGALAANVHVHPSLLSTSRVLKKTTATSQGPASGTGSAGNSSKGEQNSNSLAGASFSTFCALMSAIAGILFSSDVKVRQRAQKKGVTLGDLTSWNSTPAEEREASFVQMDRHWRRLLEKRDSLEAVKVLQEVQTSASGILQRTSYLRPSPGRTQGSIGALAGSVWAVGGGVRHFSEAELEAVRQVWDRNSDQIRQIYGFYATSKEPRRQGSGPSKLLVSFEHCREALVDFQVLPHVVDAQGYARLFKVCKMWELEVVEQLLLAQEAGHTHGDAEELAGEEALSSPLSSAKKDRGLFIRIDSFSKPGQMMSPSPGGGSGGAQESVVGGARATDDPLDLRGSVGNLCLSLSGFMELLTRIALGQQKLGARPQEALENLMHIMDASDGKAKLIRASRKSTSVRHFVYGVK